MRMVVEGGKELVVDLTRAAITAPARAAAVIDRHANEMAEEIRRASPSRRVAASVTVDKFAGGLAAEFGPNHPLAHLIEGGTGPRVQVTTGRFTGVMPPQPYVAPVTERGIPRFVDDLLRELARL